jgi:uncharacterized damage-inducible protein DinB
MPVQRSLVDSEDLREIVNQPVENLGIYHSTIPLPMLKTLLAAAALPLVVSTAAAQSSTSDTKFLWKSMLGNINVAANELSESMYAYRPTPDVRTFGELIAHIAGSQLMYCAMALGEKVPDEADVEKAAKTKTAIVAALKKSNDYCERAYSQQDADVKGSVDIFGTQRTRFFALVSNAVHNGEHYGNIVTYMRMNKLVPPSSRPRAGQ